jgi:hypothetical protein
MRLNAGAFPVLGFNGNPAHGSVSVVATASGTSLRVQVGGLAPGTTHAIHIHAGTCTTPYFGVHLYVLGFLTANGFGAGTVQGVGPRPYLAGRYYVIVYEGVDPGRIIACANLGPLSRR